MWNIQDLQLRAEAGLQAAAAAADSQIAAATDAVPEEQCAVVPDPTRPFTLTMKNGLDGAEYVVAHL